MLCHLPRSRSARPALPAEDAADTRSATDSSVSICSQPHGIVMGATVRQGNWHSYNMHRRAALSRTNGRAARGMASLIKLPCSFGRLVHPADT